MQKAPGQDKWENAPNRSGRPLHAHLPPQRPNCGSRQNRDKLSEMEGRIGRIAVPLFAFAACSAPRTAPPANHTESPPTWTINRNSFSEEQLTGSSGLSRDGAGLLWAVPETFRVLVPFALHNGTATIRGDSLPIRGVPEDLDIESMAWITRTTLVLGTEAAVDSRANDLLLFTEVQNNRAEVRRTLKVPYKDLWGLSPTSNQGIEGICHVGGRLIVAIECPLKSSGKRIAPVASFDLASKRWTAYQVPLSSPTGKLSALACREQRTHLEVHAVERHFETSRLLRFRIPLIDQPARIEPEVLVDLAPLFADGLPNFEGLELVDQNHVALISDNDFRRREGPTQLVRIKLNRDTALPHQQ